MFDRDASWLDLVLFNFYIKWEKKEEQKGQFFYKMKTRDILRLHVPAITPSNNECGVYKIQSQTIQR